MPKVMLVEDDATMRSLLGTLLEFEGFQVISWEKEKSIQDLFHTIDTERPDLLLLDVHLGAWSGFDLLRMIKANNQVGSTRILMSSGMDLYRQCKEEGADGFIMKPYMPEELISKIRKTLG